MNRIPHGLTTKDVTGSMGLFNTLINYNKPYRCFAATKNR
jgi:hypothetical protein